MKHLVSAAVALLLVAAAAQPAAGAIGDLYVLESSALVRITPGGTVSTIGSGTFSALAVDRRGNIFVSQLNDSAIYRFAPDGTKTTFATNVKAISLAFGPDGNLYAGTSPANEILRFTPAGARSQYAPIIYASGLVFDAAGNLFVTDFHAKAIYKFTPQGVKSIFTTNIPSPGKMAFDSKGDLLVTTFSNDQIVRVSPDGGQTIFTGQVSFPDGVAITANGEVLVGNTADGTIRRFSANGVPLGSFVTGRFSPSEMLFEKPYGLSLNIATRLRVQTGENVLIGGFIVTGGQPKRIIVRAIGPSLSFAGVAGALQDPVLDVFDSSGALITSIDNWKQSGQQAEIQQTGVAPTDDREAAGIFTLVPGNYTAQVRGKNDTTGIGLVEVYDLDQPANSQLANISTRGRVETGNNVLIGGFILGGNGAKVLIRAIGPSLAPSVPGALTDPTLTLNDGNGNQIAFNDDWTENQAEIQATGAAPSNNRESAILRTLTPGGYTATVAGFQNGTGVGLVEVYNLN